LPGAEPRLQRRYKKLVVSHLRPADRLAAGLHDAACPPDGADGAGAAAGAGQFAATQAAWRFYGNGSVALPQLAAPLVGCGVAGARSACDRHVLVVLDWSPLHYGSHRGKRDRVVLAHRHDLGYDLLTALAVSDRGGSPLAPLCLELRAADGVHTTRAERPLPARSRLDRLGPVMAHAAGLLCGTGLCGTGKAPVFVIDREADSVAHYRRWDRRGHRFLVRADGDRKVVHEGRQRRLSRVAALLRCCADAGPSPAGPSPRRGRCSSRAGRRGSSWPRRRWCCTARRAPAASTGAPAGRGTTTSAAGRCPCGWWSARCGTRGPGRCWRRGCC
jgi:hypothetical protein